MAITNEAELIAAAKQLIPFVKTQTATTVAAQPHSLFDRAGFPGAGSLSIGNTTTGVVPEAGNTGFPAIAAFGGGNTGYLSRYEFASTIACRLCLYDRLFHAGSVSATSNATTSLSTQPSYAARLPGGSYAGLEILVEINAAVSNNACNVSIGYRNQADSDVTSATVSIQNFATGRIARIPLNAGDTEVRRINSIIISGTSASTGSVNVVLARRLVTGRVRSANDGDTFGWARTGLVQVFETSALWMCCTADSTSSGVPDCLIEIANG